MQGYHFKIQYDRFSAEPAAGGDCSLYALAQLIIKAVGFEFDHAFQFCDNLKDPYRSKECYTLFADQDEGNENPAVTKRPFKKIVATHVTPPVQHPE